MKAFLNLLRLPFWFLYYVGGAIAGAMGIRDVNRAGVVFVVAVCLAALWLGRWAFGSTETESGAGAEASGGLVYLPSSTSHSIVRVTILEAALGHFHFRHGRSPKDFAELRRENLIEGLPTPTAGKEFQIDFRTPAIIEVPVGTPPPRHPDDPETPDAE